MVTAGRQALPRIVKVSAEGRATDLLRRQIIEGLLPAGLRVTEIQLSQEMGVSRATVRTALHQLAKEGLLTLVPYTGWTVIELTRQDVWELYTLRSAVERLAAQLVAGRAERQRLAGLRSSIESLERAAGSADAGAIAEADFSFHKAVVEAASHRRLSTQYELIEQQIRVYIRSSDALVADPAEIVAQHRPMYDAMVAGNVELAGRLAEDHNLSEGEKLASSLA